MRNEKFGFIDNMLFLVQEGYYPRLFSVKLNSVLAQAIAGVIVSGLAATAKIVL